MSCQKLRFDTSNRSQGVLVSADWRALRYATPAVRADRELMMLAVEKSNGTLDSKVPAGIGRVGWAFH